MRRVEIYCTFILLLLSSEFVLGQVNGQATIEGGYASTWVLPPGAYAIPNVPLVTTPTYEFAPPALQVGASNATTGNVAGAANSTLNTGGYSSYSIFTPFIVPGIALSSRNSEANVAAEESQSGSLDLGAATFQGDYGAAELASSRSHTHAAKTYTNDDLNQLNQKNGEVKFNNKSEHLD
ncbi:MAG TPA: hypothetical protein VFA74_05790 [Terriglobales bacterium]|nr:hypothetical protein [Terriglobales bacterium]